jgi:nucleoside-diphosphate-sugar epimerase
MKTAVITGINGFIGATLALNLISKGVKVMGVDMSDRPRNKELASLIDQGVVKVYKGDLNNFDYDQLPYADHVYQIAGKVSPWGDIKDFDHINVDGTKRVIDYASRVKAKSFLYLSSVAVYGYYGYRNLKEEDEKKPFDNPYSLSKLHAETFVMDYCKKIGMPYAVVRPGNVYGPYDYTSSFQIYSLIKKEKMPYIDKGKYISCFVYVENLADAIADAGLTEAAWNQDYNITDGVGETLHEYLSAVAKEMGVRPKFMSMPSGLAKLAAATVEGAYKIVKSKKAPLITKFSTYQNCVDYHFSIEKANKYFGYVPKVSMEEGIRRTVKWFKSLEETK